MKRISIHDEQNTNPSFIEMKKKRTVHHWNACSGIKWSWWKKSWSRKSRQLRHINMYLILNFCPANRRHNLYLETFWGLPGYGPLPDWRDAGGLGPRHPRGASSRTKSAGSKAFFLKSWYSRIFSVLSVKS